jgi:hypothetical protein
MAGHSSLKAYLPGGPSRGAGCLPCRPQQARRSLRLSPVVALGAGGIAPPCYHASDAAYTEKNGRAYLMSEDVEFTFVDDPEEQPQASAFWPLIECDEEVDSQEARRQETDDPWAWPASTSHGSGR